MAGASRDGSPDRAKGRRTRQDRALAYKRELTLNLFLRRGPFWDAVRDLRDRWHIEPEANVPGPDDKPAPPGCPLFALPNTPGADVWQQWQADVNGVHDTVIPDQFQFGDDVTSHALWLPFLGYCLLYDPPDTQLAEFAASGGPYPDDITDAFVNLAPPPIRFLRDADEAEKTANWFWMQVIEELGRRHLAPLGLDVDALIEDGFKQLPKQLREEYANRRARNRQRSTVPPPVAAGAALLCLSSEP